MKNIFEQEKTQESNNENVIDREFDALETEFNFPERMNMARDMFEELSDLDSNLRREAEFKKMLQYKEANGKDELKHFFLPDIPGGEGDLRQIREGYDSRTSYLKTDNHIFIRVGQGEVWVIPKSKNPYLKVSMSECSAIVGQNEDKIIVAHISYSALNEIEAAIDFIRQNGILPEQIMAIASMGKYQTEKSAGDFTKRTINKEEYTRYGIPPENVLTFDYQPGKQISENERISHNLTQALVNKSGVFKWSFDLRKTFHAGLIFPKEERVGDYKDEEFKEFTT